VPILSIEVHSEVSSEEREGEENQRRRRQLAHSFVLGGGHKIEDLALAQHVKESYHVDHVFYSAPEHIYFFG
jgi:hypothetical protein